MQQKTYNKEIFATEDPTKPMIFAVDWDGTITDFCYPDIGPLLPMAKETLQAIAAAGHHIIIWTCRETESIYNIMDFCKQNQIPYNAINHNTRDHEWSGSRKIYAHVYIDDRNFGGFPGWQTIYNYYKTRGII